MPVLTSDRGKIVESHRKQRDDALSLTSKAVAGPGYGKVWRRGSLTGALFSSDSHLRLSWKGVFSEFRNFPRFFHDFSTICVTKHKKSPCFIVYEQWRFKLKSGAPGGARTHHLLLRRQSLYPNELRVHNRIELLNIARASRKIKYATEKKPKNEPSRLLKIFREWPVHSAVFSVREETGRRTNPDLLFGSPSWAHCGNRARGGSMIGASCS